MHIFIGEPDLVKAIRDIVGDQKGMDNDKYVAWCVRKQALPMTLPDFPHDEHGSAPLPGEGEEDAE